MIIGRDIRFAHDTTHSAGVNNKILAEFLGRTDAGLGCDAANIGRTQ